MSANVFVFPQDLYFYPLEQTLPLVRGSTSWVEGQRLEAEHDLPGALGPQGVPVKPFNIFSGPGGNMHIECAEPWTGLISFLNEDGFAWVSRTLTGFLMANIDAYRSERLVWSENFQRFIAAPGPHPNLASFQFGDPIDLNNCGAYYWRWSDWRSETTQIQRR